MRHLKLWMAGWAVHCLLGLAACAQTAPAPAERAAAPSPAPFTGPVSGSLAGPGSKPTLLTASAPFRRVTQHSLFLNGDEVAYSAVAGETWLRDLDGAPTASIFSFSYLRTDVMSDRRPVVFVFNGGPGSASIWLHMGAIGPRRVVLGADVNPPNVPPFGLEDNPHSLLDAADLVFIDPVGTGFSVPLNGTDPKAFWGVDEDAEAVAQFIELWLSEHGRWNSPKYVLGESYGSVRAAVLARALMGGPVYTGLMRGITLDGIILLGTTLEARGPAGADPAPAQVAARQARSLPGLAVTSAYHGLVEAGPGGVAGYYAEAAAYAHATYAPALQAHLEGRLEPETRARVIAELVRFTGLSPDDFGVDIYIDERRYAKTALRSRGLEIGMYDSRYTLALAQSGGDPVADDPAMTRYVPGFIAAFHQMIRNDLDIALGRPYASIRWRDLLQSWNWARQGVADGQSFATDLAWSMRRNPDLRLLVTSGLYDLVTTPADARASLEAAGIDAHRTTFIDYESGHMLYLGGTSEAFSADLRRFIRQ